VGHTIISESFSLAREWDTLSPRVYYISEKWDTLSSPSYPYSTSRTKMLHFSSFSSAAWTTLSPCLEELDVNWRSQSTMTDWSIISYNTPEAFNHNRSTTTKTNNTTTSRFLRESRLPTQELGMRVGRPWLSEQCQNSFTRDFLKRFYYIKQASLTDPQRTNQLYLDFRVMNSDRGHSSMYWAPPLLTIPLVLLSK
jgi:hypothetical protein